MFNLTLFKKYSCLKNYLLNTLFILFFPFILIAQKNTEELKTKTEPNPYFEKKDTLFSFKFALFNIDERFEVSGSDFHYKIQPNFTLKTKFFFSYRFLSLAFAMAPNFIPGNRDDNLKGKTKTFTFNLNLITKHWVQDLQYNHTTGFYLANTADYESPGWEEGKDPYIQFPDLRVHYFRGATSYKFNPNFSLKAVRTQAEVQKKSAGSFMPSFIYSYYRINNETNSTDQQSSQKSDNLEMMAAIWYMHTFVVKRWYFSVGIAPAFGFGHTKLNTRIGSDHFLSYYNEPVIRINEQVGIGFNSQRFFTGFVFIASQTRENQGSNPVRQNNMFTTFQVFAGYRFNAPKFLRKTFNWAENLIPGKSKN
jgi:hypothetical protein